MCIHFGATTAALYFRVPHDEALRRIMVGGPAEIHKAGLELA
jgi:hypothetical protein